MTKTLPHVNICEKLLHNIYDNTNLNYMNIRDDLYNLLIYNIDIQLSMWYILSRLIHANKISHENMTNILNTLWKILHDYNNNYRPIYHLERFLFYLIVTVNE